MVGKMNEKLELNKKQLDWLCKKQNELIDYIEHHWELTEEQWKSVVQFIDKTHKESKMNNEVLKGLQEVVSVYDELTRYEQMYKRGIITKQRYEELKKLEQELMMKNGKARSN